MIKSSDHSTHGLRTPGEEIAFIDTQLFPKKEKSDSTLHFFIKGVGGFQKNYVIFGGGMSKYLLFLTGVGGWSGKGQKYPYVRNIKMPLS